MARYLEGKRVSQIAREVGCSMANVSNTIKRYVMWNGHVTPALPEPVLSWIMSEAVRLDRPASAVVRQIIIDRYTYVTGKKI